MTVVDSLRQMTPLENFEGGNQSQREHLNKMVAALNAMMGAANQEAQKIPETMRITVVANGTPIDVIFYAYLPVIPA